MPGMTLRQFNCTHCDQPFTQIEGDLILPIPRLCDDCLKTYWQHSESELLALGMAAENIQLLQTLKSRQTLTDLLAERTRARG